MYINVYEKKVMIESNDTTRNKTNHTRCPHNQSMMCIVHNWHLCRFILLVIALAKALDRVCKTLTEQGLQESFSQS